MKILFITNSLNPNDGWGRYSNGLVKEIARHHDVIVLCNSPYEFLDIDQKAFLHSPLSVSNPFKIFRSSRKIQGIIDSFKPEVVHFLIEPYVVSLPFLKLDKGTKTFLTVHGTYSFIPVRFTNEIVKLMVVSPLIKKAYKRLDGIISVSSYTKQYVLEQYKEFYKVNLEQEKIIVISNGIDLESFNFNLNKVENSYKSILFVGAIKRRKGLLQSIDSFIEYKKRYDKNFIYHIVGSYDENDPYVREVKLKIDESGLKDNVVFHGFVDSKKLESLYVNADLFLMLPVQSGLSIEGFGLVYLEANAYGVPAIGSMGSGASDAIIDGKTGYLVDPLDAMQVSERVHSVLVNKSIDSQNCIDWAKKQDIKEKTKLVLNLYKSK